MPLGMAPKIRTQTSRLSRLSEPPLVGGETEMNDIELLKCGIYICSVLTVVELIGALILNNNSLFILSALTIFVIGMFTLMNFWIECNNRITT
jgi:hypothetical protein